MSDPSYPATDAVKAAEANEEKQTVKASAFTASVDDSSPTDPAHGPSNQVEKRV